MSSQGENQNQRDLKHNSHEHVPQRMKTEILYFLAPWLDAFPVKNSLSAIYFPRELVTRWKTDQENHCRVEVGTYCEVHDNLSPSNSTESRTHEGIALGPTWESSGKY